MVLEKGKPSSVERRCGSGRDEVKKEVRVALRQFLAASPVCERNCNY